MLSSDRSRPVIKFSPFKVQPVCLESDVESLSKIIGQSTFIAGWGQKSSSGQTKDFLNEAVVQVTDQDECADQFQPGWLKKSQYCVKGINTVIDTCNGDSGGPHIKIGDDGSPILQGIISWTAGCNSKNDYSVITDVSVHSEFIDYAIQQMEAADQIPFNSDTPPREEDLLSSQVSVYTCPNPVDFFEVVRNPSAAATHQWPWLADIHNKCSGFLVGAQQVVTAAICCGKGLFMKNDKKIYIYP